MLLITALSWHYDRPALVDLLARCMLIHSNVLRVLFRAVVSLLSLVQVWRQWMLVSHLLPSRFRLSLQYRSFLQLFDQENVELDVAYFS